MVQAQFNEVRKLAQVSERGTGVWLNGQGLIFLSNRGLQQRLHLGLHTFEGQVSPTLL